MQNPGFACLAGGIFDLHLDKSAIIAYNDTVREEYGPDQKQKPGRPYLVEALARAARHALRSSLRLRRLSCRKKRGSYFSLTV